MILKCSVFLGKLSKAGKGYPWKRPHECPKCGNAKVWGHGFCERMFNRVKKLVLLKRWRCPACGLVMTCRPEVYWRRYQESVDVIYLSIERASRGNGRHGRQGKGAGTGSEDCWNIPGTMASYKKICPPPCKYTRRKVWLFFEQVDTSPKDTIASPPFIVIISACLVFGYFWAFWPSIVQIRPIKFTQFFENLSDIGRRA